MSDTVFRRENGVLNPMKTGFDDIGQGGPSGPPGEVQKEKAARRELEAQQDLESRKRQVADLVEPLVERRFQAQDDFGADPKGFDESTYRAEVMETISKAGIDMTGIDLNADLSVPGDSGGEAAGGDPEGTPEAQDAAGALPPGKLLDKVAVDSMADWVELDLLSRGGGKQTAKKYAAYCSKFLRWSVIHGDINTLPPGAILEFCALMSQSPASQNVIGQGIKSAFQSAAVRGYKFPSHLLLPKHRVTKKAEPVRPIAPAAVIPSTPPLRFDMAPPAAADPFAIPPNGAEVPFEADYNPPMQAGPISVPTDPHAQDPRPYVPPRPVPVAPKPQVAAPQRKMAAASPFPIGGRVRVLKRATNEAGIPPGRLILIGDYFADDLSGEGPIGNFIRTHIVPQFGPHPGGQTAIYVVERLDDRGQIIQGQAYEIPILAPRGDGTNTNHNGNGGQMNGNNNGHQQPQTSKAEEKLLDYLTSNERDAKERYDKLLEQVSTKGSAGMDPMALMMLLERSKPQPLPWKEMMAELKANQPSPFESKLDKSLSGLDALMMAPAPEKKDHATEALGRIVESLIAAQVKTAATPAPAAVVPVQDPLMGQILTALIAKAFAVPTGPTALEAKLDKIIEINLTPQKSKGMSELGGDMVAMIELMKKLRPEEEPPPHPLVETIGLIAENADKLGDALAKIMTSRQAPQLPAGNGATEATGTQLPKPPDAAVAGLKTMAEATTDQGIINGLDGTLKALATGPEAYQRFAKAVVGAYIEADSLPAIRSVVTQLFIKCGQKDIATEPVIEKVTKSLTAHYSFLHKTLTGREKTLPVTEAKPPPVTVTEVKPEVKPEGAKVIDFVKPAQVEATKEPVKEAAKEAITMPAPTKVSDPMAALMNTVGAAERSEEEEEEEEEEEDDEGPLTETDFDEMWADMSSEERVLFLKKAQKMAGS